MTERAKSESEHASASTEAANVRAATLPPAAVAAAAALLRQPSRRAPGVWPPDFLVAVQQSSGNGAVGRLFRDSRVDLGRSPGRTLARQNPPSPPKHKATTDTGDIFDFKGGTPTISDNVHVIGDAPDDPAGTLLIEGPRIEATAEVWIKPGKSLAGGGYVGWIQNLVKSDQGNVYRVGGESGDLVAEVHETKKRKWDAYEDPTKKGPGGKDIPQETVFPPFYNVPKGISDLNQAGLSITTTMKDQPRRAESKEYRAGEKIGRLTELTGSEVFKLALGVLVNSTGEVVYLKGFDYTVPWSTKIGLDWQGTGGTIGLSEIEAAKLAAEGPDPNLTEWAKTAKADVFRAFSTRELADKQTPTVLMKWLLPARRNDPVSYKNICDSLDGKDPVCKAQLTCDDAPFVGARRRVMSMEVWSGSNLVRSLAGIRMDKGDSPATVELGKFKTLFGPAGAISESTSVTIKLNRTTPGVFSGSKDDNAEATVGWPLSDRAILVFDNAKFSASLEFS